MQCHCIPLWCQFLGKDDLSVSAWMDSRIAHHITDDCSNKTSWSLLSEMQSTFFPFPHFLVPTFSLEIILKPLPDFIPPWIYDLAASRLRGSGLGRRLLPASVHSPPDPPVATPYGLENMLLPWLCVTVNWTSLWWVLWPSNSPRACQEHSWLCSACVG